VTKQRAVKSCGIHYELAEMSETRCSSRHLCGSDLRKERTADLWRQAGSDRTLGRRHEAQRPIPPAVRHSGAERLLASKLLHRWDGEWQDYKVQATTTVAKPTNRLGRWPPSKTAVWQHQVSSQAKQVRGQGFHIVIANMAG
jgi:hypothetical protein